MCGSSSSRTVNSPNCCPTTKRFANKISSFRCILADQLMTAATFTIAENMALHFRNQCYHLQFNSLREGGNSDIFKMLRARCVSDHISYIWKRGLSDSALFRIVTHDKNHVIGELRWQKKKCRKFYLKRI